VTSLGTACSSGDFLTRHKSHVTFHSSCHGDLKILETFPNPAPHRDYVIEHTHHEFTSLCPMTGHPDFADITVRYIAGKSASS